MPAIQGEFSPMKYLRNYLIVVGILTHIALVVSLVGVLMRYELTPRQLMVRALEKSKVDIPFLKSALKAPELFPNYIPVSVFNENSPRILPQVKKILTGDITRNDFNKATLKKYNPCSGNDLMGSVSCWLYKKDEKSKQVLLNKLRIFTITLPSNDGRYGSGWKLALAYDSIRTTEILEKYEEIIIEKKLLNAIDHYLLLLNGDSASQWHGRATLTAQMWLCLIAIGKPPIELLQKVESHFEQLVQAIELTPAWPEGYNYWINNRALHISLAFSSYLTGTRHSRLKQRVATALDDLGYWHIYATRPDNTIEPIADKGARLDLKDETRRVIDVIAQVTGNNNFHYFSSYLESLHQNESYYRDYRWGYFLFHNPKFKTIEGADNLALYNNVLPYSRIFGEEHYGLAFFRQDWGADATFMNFKAGDTFTHHGHYDAGHFSMFKRAPLIVNSSEYGSYVGGNRLNYAIRTIAKNSIIIQKPEEQVKPNRFFKANVADGGQRILLPTGSAIQSVDDWYKKRSTGQVLAGGEVKKFEANNSFTYIKSDLTKAYNSTWYDENNNGGKIKSANRSLLYLREEDTLLVFDEVEPTDKKYRVKSILHTVNMPFVEHSTLLKGTEHNGIYRSDESSFKVENGIAKLVGTVFHDGYLQLVGGDDYKFYVEVDGDDSKLNGKNFDAGLSQVQYNQAANWRIEIVSTKAKHHQILTILQPSLHTFKNSPPIYKRIEGGVATILNNHLIVIAGGQEPVRIKVTSNVDRMKVVGLNTEQQYQLTMNDKVEMISFHSSVDLNIPQGTDFIELRLINK